VTWIAVATTLFAVTVIAGWLAAKRIAQLDPAAVLESN